MRHPLLAIFAIASAGLFGAHSANATQIGSDINGSDINLVYSCNFQLNGGNAQCGGEGDNALTATATFQVFDTAADAGVTFSSDFYVKISFANTSTAVANLTAIGFNYPDGATFDSTEPDYIELTSYGFDSFSPPGNTNWPGGITLDTCAESGANCNGGLSSGGLGSPQNPPPVAMVVFGFGAGTNPDTTNPYTAQEFYDAFVPVESCVRFNSVGADREDSGSACGRTRPDDPRVPEPDTLALLGFGLMAIGLRRRWGAKLS